MSTFLHVKAKHVSMSIVSTYMLHSLYTNLLLQAFHHCIHISQREPVTIRMEKRESLGMPHDSILHASTCRAFSNQKAATKQIPRQSQYKPTAA